MTEQFASADLLAVMLFADEWGKKTRQLKQAAELHRYVIILINILKISKVRDFVFLILIMSSFGCSKDGDTNPNSEKLFDYAKISQLNLADINTFWTEGIKIDTSFYMGAHFENHQGFINGIRLFSGNGKAIWISIFKSKDNAIDAMDQRINDVACVINSGDTNELETQWWFSDCIDYFIFVNQYNTIIEIDFASNAPFELIKGTLLDVAKEINKRIDVLSD